MTKITIEQARSIIAGALAEGRRRGFAPLSVVVLDAGGHVIAFEREDGASPGRFAIALGKASGAIHFGASSRKIGEIAAERPQFVASLGTAFPHGAIPAAGGVLIRHNGTIVGAVGITGDTSDNDETCAIAGIEKADLSEIAGA